MGRVAKNVGAGIAGNIWTAAVHLAFVPVYIRLMGIEAYGLVGVFLTLQALMLVIDTGLGAMINREIARLSAAGGAGDLADFVRTMELVYSGIAIVLAAALLALAGVLARHWIHAEKISDDVVHVAVMWMAGAIAAQFLVSLYGGMLAGLQRQVELNVITAAAMTIRAIGAVAALLMIERSVIIFFVWQLIVTMLHALVLRHFVWRRRSDSAPRFRIDLLRETRRFAGGTTAMSVLSLILGQTDKILLSHLLTLSAFGYYALASVASSMTYRITGPIWQAVFPRMTELVATNDREQLVRTFHQASQAMTIFIFPPFLLLAVFSKEILRIWTRDPASAANTHTVMTILVIGSALHAMMYVPYAVQLAHGETALTVKGNLVAVVLQVPLVVFLTSHRGVNGAAAAWLMLAFYQVGILASLLLGRYLPAERMRWYGADVLLPAGASLIPIVVGRLFIHDTLPAAAVIAALAVIGLLSFGAALLASSALRPAVRSLIVKI